MDFTLSVYNQLLHSLTTEGYSFTTFKNFLLDRKRPNHKKNAILRHDVERFPINAYNIAEIEYSLGIRSTFYFRISTNSFNPSIITKIATLGHEIGYHYDDVETSYWVIRRKNFRQKVKKELLIDAAYESFVKNLEKLRTVADITTICMHGSPLSKYDNRLIWDKYNYRDLGITGEPYYDIDWANTAYFTDTGRRWNGCKVSVRDKVDSNHVFDFKSTKKIIANINMLPENIFINTHTHRWFDPGIMWTRELIYQNLKNIIKYFIIHLR